MDNNIEVATVTGLLRCTRLNCQNCEHKFLVFIESKQATIINCPFCENKVTIGKDCLNNISTVYKVSTSSQKDKTSDFGSNVSGENDRSSLIRQVLGLSRPSINSTARKGSTSYQSCVQLSCNVCENETNDDEAIVYCTQCKQKLCPACTHIHDRLGGTLNHVTQECLPETAIIYQSIVSKLQEQQSLTIDQLASELIQELGLQICVNHTEQTIELLASSADILDLATETVTLLAEPENEDQDSVQKILRHGKIQWTIKGNTALTIIKLFDEEVDSIVKNYDVKLTIYKNGKDYDWSEISINRTNGTPVDTDSMTGPSSRAEVISNLLINHASLYESSSDLSNSDLDLTIKVICEPEHLYEVDCEMQEILDEVQTLPKTEVIRPKQDEFRMKVYTILKETDRSVICYTEQVDSVYKLVIKARDADTLDDMKQEFLSVFCKECSSCHEESPRPTFLECKHVLCHDCVKMSASYGDGLRCPLCSNNNREKTPVTSLQLQCLQTLDNTRVSRAGSVTIVNTSRHQSSIVRRKSSLARPQSSTKIPKYILSKWKKMTGGLLRLKSLIENNYGFKVAGPDENLKIYGEQQELLELAIHSLEKLNDITPESGFSHRLADNCVEWRLRGEHAQIAFFLFPKELNRLSKKFRTVTVQAFTESLPAIVDVKCGYKEYVKVKYEMEELENDIRNLYTDECIQPRNFYYNVKVKEYVNSKRRDEKVHCSVAEKNNLNVIIIKGRKKDYVNEAKDQLSNW